MINPSPNIKYDVNTNKSLFDIINDDNVLINECREKINKINIMINLIASNQIKNYFEKLSENEKKELINQVLSNIDIDLIEKNHGDAVKKYGLFFENYSSFSQAGGGPVGGNLVPIILTGKWFENAFGFTETNYEFAKKQFERMYNESGKKSINGINVGKFKLHSLNSFDTLKNKTPSKIHIENIIDDIMNIHADPNLSNNSTIQVASQFNCLEMADSSYLPEYGITIYMNDNTQGPLCAMSAPAGYLAAELKLDNF